MKNSVMPGKLRRYLLLALVFALPPQMANGQAWDAVKYFKYNIDNVTVTPVVAGTWNVKVIFSVTNPTLGGFWNIRNDAPFTSAGAGLTLDIGWDPASDFTNTGSANPALSPVVTTALGTGAAIPVQVRGLQGNIAPAGVATACDLDPSKCPGVTPTGRFWVARNVTPRPLGAVKDGRVAIEGKPVCNGIAGFTCPTTVAPFANVPVPSVVASFAFTATESLAAMIPDPRRQIVDIAKCQQCHDNKQHGATIVPKLSLHGNNRTENLGLCVMCHNPNQTDVPYRYQTTGTTADPRIAGPEVPIDFKVLVHSIHSGGFRVNPYVVVGFQSSVNDFSDVRFPRELRNCVNCHIDASGKGTFELPIKSTLGTTVTTQSIYLVAPPTATPPGVRAISVDPADDLKITPIAAACSACHDKAEVKSHMVRTGGASFGTLQANIGVTVKEKCANCHGPGKEEDVRRAHEISRSGGGGD